MKELEFLGPAGDGEALVFSDEDGERYRVVATPELRAEVSRTLLHAVPKTPSTPSAGPGYIQSLLRQGLTPAEVAEQTDSDVDRVLRYYSPVEAEIARAVQIAQQSRVGNEPDSPLMGELVIDRLAARGIDPETVQWTASKEPGSDWVTCMRFPEAGELRSARWTVPDGRGRAVAVDSVARELTETVELLSPVDSLFAPTPLHPRGGTPRQVREAATIDVPVTPRVSEEDPRTADRLRQEDLVERLNRLRGKHGGVIEELVEEDDEESSLSVVAVIDEEEERDTAPLPVRPESESVDPVNDDLPGAAASAAEDSLLDQLTEADEDASDTDQDALWDVPSSATSEAGPDQAPLFDSPSVEADDRSTSDDSPESATADSVGEVVADLVAAQEPAPSTSTHAAKKPRRTPVPSWDEIIFGRQQEQAEQAPPTDQ